MEPSEQSFILRQEGSQCACHSSPACLPRLRSMRRAWAKRAKWAKWAKWAAGLPPRARPGYRSAFAVARLRSGAVAQPVGQAGRHLCFAVLREAARQRLALERDARLLQLQRGAQARGSLGGGVG